MTEGEMWILGCTIVTTLVAAGALIVSVAALKRKTDVQITPQPLSIQGVPPGGDVLARDMKSLNHRVSALENWRGELMNKLEDDKMEILRAGEERGEKIHQRINNVLGIVSEVKGIVEQMNR